MPHPTTIARRKMKEDDPEKYEEFRRKQRERDNRRNADKKRRWEEESHTRAQIIQREEELEARRAKDRQRYHAKKMAEKRQTRTSSTPQLEAREKKRPRDMTPDEYRAHRAEQKRLQRSRMSYQKKVAIRLKRREKRRQERAAKLPVPSASATPDAEPSNRLRQSLYNLNHEYRQSAKKLGVSNEEYARSTLNLLNPRTPEKRAAIREEQKRHPARTLFGEAEHEPPMPNLEEELGVDLIEDLVHGPENKEEISKPLHQDIKLFYLRDEISRMLPHARYSSKHGAARVVVCTVKDAYASFMRERQNKVSLSLFQSLRPRNVRLMGSVALESCLCVYCTNVR